MLQFNYQGNILGGKKKKKGFVLNASSWSALQIPSQVTVAMHAPVNTTSLVT